MDEKLFRDLTGALQDAVAFERGENIALRVTKFPPAPKPMPAKEVLRLRKRLALSQAVFARHLNVTPATVRSWEQGVRRPSKAALKLLHIVKKEPSVLAM
jgi:putative transcriptional regulator